MPFKGSNPKLLSLTVDRVPWKMAFLPWSWKVWQFFAERNDLMKKFVKSDLPLCRFWAPAQHVWQVFMPHFGSVWLLWEQQTFCTTTWKVPWEIGERICCNRFAWTSHTKINFSSMFHIFRSSSPHPLWFKDAEDAKI